MKRDKNTIQRFSKTIMKPKFTRFFLITLAFAILISISISYKILERKEDELREEISNRYSLCINNVTEAARNLYESSQDSYSKRLQELEWTLLSLHEFDAYASVYLGTQKIMDSNDVIGVVARIRCEDGSNDFAYLEEMSYLDPIKEYFGKDSFEEHMDKAKKFEWDELAIRYWIDKDYSGYGLVPVDVYVNWETHRFLPGVVECGGGFDSQGSIVRVDCTPDDTRGYEHAYTSVPERKNMVGTYVVTNHYLKDTPVLTETNCDSVIVDRYNETLTMNLHDYYSDNEFNQSCNWYVKYTEPEILSRGEIIPFTKCVYYGAALFIAILIALIISVILYLRSKTVWEIFDYRKKTTEAMAHDLKTPLHSLSIYSETLEDLCQDKEEAEYSTKIRQTVQEMNSMVEGILDFSRSEGTDRQVVRKETDICQMLKDCIERYTPVLASRNIQFEFKESPCNIKTDPILISQCIDNLMSNCSRYADPDSKITAEVTSDSVSFKNRTSQDLDDVEKLKQPFVKGSAARNKGGSGLGLSIVDNNLSVLGHKLELDLADHIFTARIRF